MPKSKRDKRISLTKTEKKGLERKQNLIEEIRKSLDIYERIFLFNVYNMRSSHMKEVRKSWDHSRFFFGKNKVMAIALGKSPESEMMDNLHKMSAKLENEVGLLFTNKSKDYVIDWFASYSKFDYARSGNEATSTVELDEGPLYQFSHSIEPHLRKLGLPVTLKKGIVTMLRKHTVCKEGETLTPEQADILKLLKVVLSEFSIGLEYMWDKENGQFHELENKPKDKAFNVVRVSSDDQEYDFIEKENITKDNASQMDTTTAEPAIQKENLVNKYKRMLRPRKK